MLDRLFQAIYQGSISECRDCLEKGVRLQCRNEEGETPLQLAQQLRQKEIARLIQRTQRIRHVQATLRYQQKRNQYLDSLGADRRRPYLRFK
jgi:hypothetical protein